MSDHPTLVRIELGPLRAALQQFADHGLELVDEERCAQISSVMRVTLCDLSPEQCIGIYAAMLLTALPEAPANA